MPIVTIASTKGGVGKSTLTVNLVAQLTKEGHKVALLDSDPQGSATKWNRVREMMIREGENLPSIFVAAAQGEALAVIAQERAKEGFFVFIDSAGFDDQSTRTALVKSDYILTISSPDPIDLWEVDTVLKLVGNLEKKQNRRIPLYLVFNKVSTHPNVKDVEDAKEFLDAQGIFPTHTLQAVIRNRRAFKYTIGEGKGVVEYTPTDTAACREIEQVCTEILQLIQTQPQPKPTQTIHA